MFYTIYDDAWYHELYFTKGQTCQGVPWYVYRDGKIVQAVEKCRFPCKTDVIY